MNSDAKRTTQNFTLEELKSEQWKDIREYSVVQKINGKTVTVYPYRISNLGRIQSAYGQICHAMTPQVNTYGHLFIMLTGKLPDGKASCELVGKMVAKYFVDNPNEYTHISFKDGNLCNCKAENIEWIRLTEKQVSQYNSITKKVNKYSLDGIYICTYNSAKEAADEMDCDKNEISAACRRNEKVGDYLWRYDKDSSAEKNIKPYVKKAKIVYAQYNRYTKELIAVYESIEAVARFLGKKPSQIQANVRNCCKGKRPTAYGYVWDSEERYD